MTPRLVMTAGVSGGVGKTTLVERLVPALSERGVTATLIPESVIFDLELLDDIATAFRTKDFPGPELLVDGFGRLLGSLPEVDVAVMDGNWLLLGEDLPWAQASLAAVTNYARGLLAAAERHDPVLLFLDDDVESALARKRSRDGDARDAAGIEYLRGLPALALWRDCPAAELTTAWSNRMRAIWSEVGMTTIEISARGSREAVVARAVGALT